MGIRDRKLVEKLTTQVIERLEKARTQSLPTLPGMEDLVDQRSRHVHRGPMPTEAEIEAMVMEVLNAQKPAPEPVQKEEVKAEMETETEVKTPKESASADGLTATALQVLERRYLLRDSKGKVTETPEELFRRVARAVAAAELNYNPKADVNAVEDEFFKLMYGLDFLPNSPTLMNAGKKLGQLSACFVLPVDDSMESIFDAVKYTALIHKSGGGTGFSFSRLRPENDVVGSTGGVASGPVSFMRAFDTVTDVTKQGGTRRGANMGIMNIDHPDILKFITAKEDKTALTNFNISVALTADFMEAVKSGADYDLVNPHTKEVTGRLNAKEVFDKIVDMAWRTGDPGIIFIDRINESNPTPHLGKIESTNPCGEQPLLPYESCNLASINLSHMMKKKGGGYEIDHPRLASTIKTAVRFLDNVIEVNKFPLPQIDKMTKQTRKIGLGIMGFADMLVMLGVPYSSEEALDIAEKLMKFIAEESLKASIELAKERGAFPAFKDSIYDVPEGPPVRNATRTTIAPTGTLSMIAGCSSGIEPIFALSYTKTVLDGTNFVEVNPYFEEAARKGGFYSDALMKKLAEGAHLGDIEGVPDEVKRVFVTAHEITPEWHVKMQAAFQRSTDNAVSKTINFPQSATREDVAQAYTLAYEEGLKGITIYRDRSRDTQVLTTGKKQEKTEEETAARAPRNRPSETRGTITKVNTGCGNLYITVAYDDKGIFEVFSTLGKSGGCATAQLEAICRLITLALRSGVDVSQVVKQLRGIRCPSIAWENGKSILSCADAIASVLEKHISADDKPRTEDYGLSKSVVGQMKQCPECQNLLVFSEGCYHCPACGYTKC
ncbi:MAG: vitamin B12-dependent ribonucleotide reductase [Dehalococcoidales bacterium]|nr:vitamin B12-dependent ribonucleotide reductase [Dehalococcoidales bacterium]